MKRKILHSVIAMCAGIAGTASALTIDEQFSGQYVETGGTSNRGVNLQMFKIGPELFAAFVTGFTYDADGNQIWFAGTDTSVVPGDVRINVEARQFNGGQPFGGDLVAASDNPVVASIDMQINTCNSATLNIAPVGDANFPEVTDAALNRGSIVFGPDRCAYQSEFTACPAFSDGSAEAVTGIERSCIISGTFNQDITLTNDTTWVMNGPVFIGNASGVGNSNSVTIEPGTRIVASGAAAREAFIVARGAKIFADGQPFAPIVFSSIRPTSEAEPGDFGGVIISGAAPANDCPQGDCEGEGNSGQFGGDDPFDSSGRIVYVRIQFGGDSFNPEDQLNGLALQATGAGTVVKYLQVHANTDDGVEFFGGTTSASYVVLTDIEDDSIDWTFGWQGDLQHALVQAGPIGDNGIEADNNSGGNELSPRSQPRIANVSFIGNDEVDVGNLLRAGTGANLTNNVVAGYGDGCLDIDDDSTFTQSGTPGSLNGTLTVENTVLDCTTNFIEDGGEPFGIEEFFTSQDGNETLNVTFVNGVFPQPGASYLSGKVMDPAKFNGLDLVDYAGAFSSEAADWTAGWTDFINN
ncbi:MAG: hypothetical protein KKC01_13155 [Gammaproteobacteria bacterium]|nr:hypothetical protein [Gammaproteobacteria bacterium]